MGFFSFLQPVEHAAEGSFNFLKDSAVNVVNAGKNAIDVGNAGRQGAQGLAQSLFAEATHNPTAAVNAANKTQAAINYSLNASRGAYTPQEAASTNINTSLFKPLARNVGTYLPLALGPEVAGIAGKTASLPFKFLASAGTGAGINAGSTALQEVGSGQSLNPKEIAKSAALGAGLGAAGEGIAAGSDALKTAQPLNEVGSIGKNINDATDVKIPIGDQGFLRVTQDELKNLTEAKSATDVKAIIGDALPQPLLDRVAGPIALTKDPNTIVSILDRATLPPTPLPPAVTPPISDVAPVVADNNVAGKGSLVPNNTPLSPELQAAVDLATKPSDVGTVNINPEGKVKQLAGQVRTAFSGEKNAQIQGASVLADTFKKLAPEEQGAITWFREAKGDTATLQDWLSRPNLEPYRADIEQAMHLSPEAQQVSSALDQVYAKAGGNAVEQGTLQNLLTDYTNPRIYQQPDNQPGVVSGILKQTTSAGKQRVFENLPEAIDNGHLPATTNAADLAQVHLSDLARVNTTRNLLQGMSDAGLGKFIEPDKIPQGFTQVGNLRNGSQVFAAPEELAKGLRAITEPDFIRRVDGWRGIAAYQGLVKTVDLSYSLFHHITEAAQLAYQTKGGIDILRHGSDILKSINSPDFAAMENNFVKNGGITTKVSDVQDVMRNLIGTDKSAYGHITNAPGIKQALGVAEKSSSLLFDKAQRWLKVTDYQSKMTTWIEKHPEATPAEFQKAATGYAKEVNSAYGGLNWEAMGVTKTSQSVMRGLLLAPDWVVSNIALAKYGLGGGVEGSAARAHLVTAFSTGLVATEALNKSITGHFTNENPKGHKWEVEIAPNVYVSLFRGGIGDVLKIVGNIQDKGVAQGTAQFAQGKLSPLARTVVGLASGTQFTGQPITNKNDNFAQKTVGEAKFLATSLLPVPFGVSSTTKYINDAVKSKEPVNPLVAASLGVGLSRFTKTSNGLSTREQASISNLAKRGASKTEQNANVQFYLTLKKTAQDRTTADKAITAALVKGDTGAAQQAATDYNNKLAKSFSGWVGKYGTYSNASLEKAYKSNKINLTSDSIKARTKSIKNNPLYSASIGGQ